MFDLTVVARRGRWVLVDDAAGELGAYATRKDALDAAGSYEWCPYDEERHVLIQEETGEWDEAVLHAPSFH